MIKEFQQLYVFVKNTVEKHFISYLNYRLVEQKKIITSVTEIIHKYSLSISNIKKNKNELLEKAQQLHKELFTILESKHTGHQEFNYDEEFRDFLNTINENCISYEEKRISVQQEDRFQPQSVDSLIFLFYKFFKRFLRYCYRIPYFAENFVLKLFKKQPKPLPDWKQIIPLQNLTLFYFREELSTSLLQLIAETNKMKGNTYYRLWKLVGAFDTSLVKHLDSFSEDSSFQFDVKIETENILNEIDTTADFIKSESQLLIAEIISAFENAYNKAGTIELPKNTFSSLSVRKKHQQLNDYYRSMNHLWENSFFTLFDQWRLYEELYMQKYYSYYEYERTVLISGDKINNNIAKGINEIIEILEKTRKTLEKESENSETFRGILINEKTYLRQHLSESFLPSAIEKLVDQNLPQLVNDLDENLKINTNELSSKRSIIKGTNYAREVKNSEIESFSPKDLVKTEILNLYFFESRMIKTSIIDAINNMQKKMEELDQIAEFNLDAAISLYDLNSDSIEESKNVAVEGLERAISKTKEVYTYIKIINNTFTLQLKKAVDKYASSLISLTETEKVMQIKLRIAAAKTTEKAKNVKLQIYSSLKNTYPHLTTATEKIKKDFQLYNQLLRKKFGFVSIEKKISSEISDYLSETKSAIEKLPFVYQRLFRAEPLHDERFFEGREEAIEIIMNSYNNWTKGRFAPVFIYGERGSGATTLINFSLKKINPYSFVYRTSVDKTIYLEDDFLRYLTKFLNAHDIKSFDELADWLNNLDSRQVIVIENLQNLFLRIVGGFQSIQKLFELISKTNKNIFWITTCSLYASKYLSKTVNIHEYFSYEILLDKLEDTQIINIILKRHRVSGYDLYFTPTELDLKQSSFRKLSEDEQQKLLKKKYFAHLNKMVKSNISLAQLFWLRSISSIKNNTIVVNSLNDLDFSFMVSLSDTKVFTLAGLLIHEGLSLNDLSLVFNQSNQSSKTILISLLDDGIIFNDNEYFKINPLLYRQTVNLLISRNILH